MRLTKTFHINEQTLIKYCKKFSGSYINNINRFIAPCAITYATEFCDAAADLLILYKKYNVLSPLTRLLEQFQQNEILTCRGLQMNDARINYLYQKFLLCRIKTNNYFVLVSLTKTECPICGKLKSNIEAHIKAVH